MYNNIISYIGLGFALVLLSACGESGGGGSNKCGTVINIGLNSSVEGTLENGDCRADDIFPGTGDMTFVDEYRITLNNGGILDITMRSADFDAFIVLMDTSTSCANGCDLTQIIATDDDTDVGFDALISIDLAAGTYGIGANSIFPATGSYTLETVFEEVPISSADSWDLNNGILVTDSSPTLGSSDILNIFGGVAGSVEPENTLFADNLVAGTVHFVEWQTPTPVTISNFKLFAHRDGDTSDRSFNRFTLFAKDLVTGNFETLSELSSANPYADTPCNLDPPVSLEVSINVPTTTAQEFRAEFEQFASPSSPSGPRVLELDGFEDADPNGCVP